MSQLVNAKVISGNRNVVRALNYATTKDSWTPNIARIVFAIGWPRNRNINHI